MASATISGLTVKIGAETEGFQKAIREIDRVSKNVAKDLKNVSDSMKLDPTAIQTYSDKFKLLQEAVDTSAKKVKLAQDAISALDKDFKDGKVSPEEYAKAMEALKRQLESAIYEHDRSVSALRNFDKEMKNASESVEDMTEETEKANKAYLVFYEKTSKAADENKELTDTVQKANKAYLVYYEKTSKAADGNRELGDTADNAGKDVRKMGDETEKAGKGFISLSDIIKGNLISSEIKNGFNKLIGLVKEVGRVLIDAGKELFKFSKECVDMAAQYQDAVEYSEKVFGEYAGQVQAWVKENSEALRIGIANLQVYMNDLGTAFSALGLNHKDAMDMAEDLIELSADVRAATGKDIDEIISAMTRGFTSSTRNFRQFGVYVGEADIKIQALKDGMIEFSGSQEELAAAIANVEETSRRAQEAMDAYGEESDQFKQADEEAAAAAEVLNALLGDQNVTLTSSQRAMALYNLVTERLSFLMGQNKKESGLYNSQLALLKTNFENLKLEIGEKLLPVFTDFITRFNDFIASEEGQAFLDRIVQAFEKLAKKVSEMLANGELENLLNKVVESAPAIVDFIESAAEWLIEMAPYLGDVVQKIAYFFGYEDEAAKTKMAYKEVKDSVEEMAKSYDTSTGTMRDAIALWAQENGLKLSDVYSNWSTYEPQINEWLQTLVTDAGSMEEAYNTKLAELPTDMQAAVDEAGNIDFSKADQFRETVRGWADDIIGWFKEVKNWSVSDWFSEVIGWFKGGDLGETARDWFFGGSDGDASSTSGLRSGSSVYIPGGSMSSGRSASNVSNNVNNSRTVGAVNVYVNSYGMDLATVSEELGTAVQQKLRMSGAII